MALFKVGVFEKKSCRKPSLAGQGDFCHGALGEGRGRKGRLCEEVEEVNIGDVENSKMKKTGFSGSGQIDPKVLFNTPYIFISKYTEFRDLNCR